MKNLFVLLSLCIVSFLSGCEKEEVFYNGAKQGVYEVKLEFSGDIVGYKPDVYFFPNYNLSDVHNNWIESSEKLLLDSNGLQDSTNGVHLYANDSSFVFRPMAYHTTRKASGMTVSFYCANPLLYVLPEYPKITAHFQGFINGKLVKDTTMVVTAGERSNFEAYDADFQIGENALGDVK